MWQDNYCKQILGHYLLHISFSSGMFPQSHALVCTVFHGRSTQQSLLCANHYHMVQDLLMMYSNEYLCRGQRVANENCVVQHPVASSTASNPGAA